MIEKPKECGACGSAHPVGGEEGNDPVLLTRYIERDLCPGCPSSSRWAREIVAEAAAVKYAKSKGQPLPAGEKPGYHWVGGKWSQEKPTRAASLAMMIGSVPLARWRLVCRYLKAKVPYVLGFRSKHVESRRKTCLTFGVMCGQCGKPATWSQTAGGFTCAVHPDFFVSRSQADAFAAPCRFMYAKGEKLFCRACSCGERRDANLAVKTQMPFAQCPMGYWPVTRSSSEDARPSFEDASTNGRTTA